MSDSPVGPEDIRAAAETYRELGPDYHDAVIASFVDRIDREVDARVEARLAELAAAPPPGRRRRPVLRGSIAAGAAALAVLAAVAAASGSRASPMARPVQVGRGPAVVIPRHVINGPDGQKIIVPRRVIRRASVPQAPQAPQAPRAPQAPPAQS